MGHMDCPGSSEPILERWCWRSVGTLCGLIRVCRAKQRGWLGNLQPTPDIKAEGGKKGGVSLKGGWRGKWGEAESQAEAQGGDVRDLEQPGAMHENRQSVRSRHPIQRLGLRQTHPSSRIDRVGGGGCQPSSRAGYTGEGRRGWTQGIHFSPSMYMLAGS